MRRQNKHVDHFGNDVDFLLGGSSKTQNCKNVISKMTCFFLYSWAAAAKQLCFCELSAPPGKNEKAPRVFFCCGAVLVVADVRHGAPLATGDQVCGLCRCVLSRAVCISVSSLLFRDAVLLWSHQAAAGKPRQNCPLSPAASAAEGFRVCLRFLVTRRTALLQSLRGTAEMRRAVGNRQPVTPPIPSWSKGQPRMWSRRQPGGGADGSRGGGAQDGRECGGRGARSLGSEGREGCKGPGQGSPGVSCFGSRKAGGASSSASSSLFCYRGGPSRLGFLSVRDIQALKAAAAAKAKGSPKLPPPPRAPPMVVENTPPPPPAPHRFHPYPQVVPCVPVFPPRARPARPTPRPTTAFKSAPTDDGAVGGEVGGENTVSTANPSPSSAPPEQPAPTIIPMALWKTSGRHGPPRPAPRPPSYVMCW